MVAVQYGLTPAEFLSFTPRQLQMILEPLRIRSHNQRALELQMHGFKSEFIDADTEKMMRSIKAQRDKQSPSVHDRMEAHVGKIRDGKS